MYIHYMFHYSHKIIISNESKSKFTIKEVNGAEDVVVLEQRLEDGRLKSGQLVITQVDVDGAPVKITTCSVQNFTLLDVPYKIVKITITAAAYAYPQRLLVRCCESSCCPS
jgi:hypothetical protein